MLTIHKQHTALRLGFTMIELLIVVAIISSVFIIGIANFRDFQGRQKTTLAFNDLITDLRLAHKNAISGVRDQCRLGAAQFQGYSFTPTGCDAGNYCTSYEIKMKCSTGDIAISTKTLPEGVRYKNNLGLFGISYLLFNTLSKGTNITIGLGLPFTVDTINGTDMKSFSVFWTGEVYEDYEGE